jgi:hypothetical protein
MTAHLFGHALQASDPKDKTTAFCPEGDVMKATIDDGLFNTVGQRCASCNYTPTRNGPMFRCEKGCDYYLCKICIQQGKGSKQPAAQRRREVMLTEISRDVNRLNQRAVMALMLRHISGKRDFDLFATPITDERLFSKEDLKTILSAYTTNRLSARTQERLSEIDSPLHFHDVSLDVLFDTVGQCGFRHSDLEDAVLEVMSHRHDYRHDTQMQEWMSEHLVHVKYDFTSKGTFRVGDTIPIDDYSIYDITELKPCTLRSVLPSGGKPLVILAGSWS